ncbi:MAG: Zn-dependent oligopeptidase [Elusimicrobia bacterium]|nr:Zn-dependent oligopeptidase [Elusimicrobiota bacterium]
MPAGATLTKSRPSLDFTLAPKDIESGASAAIARAKARCRALADLPAGRRTFENTVMELDRLQDDLSTELAARAFLQHVSPDEDVRKASRGCDASVDKFFVDLWSREDLYRAVQDYAAKREALEGQDAKLLRKTLDAFRRAGLALGPVERARLKLLKSQLVELELAYRARLGEVKDTLAVTAKELDGLPPDFVARLKRDGPSFLVTMDAPDYYGFMQNAKDPAARRRLEELYLRRGGPENVALLEEALLVRRRIARTLGYESYAHYVLEERMAKRPEAVRAFLSRLRSRLGRMAKAERRELLGLKRRDLPAAKTLESSDLFYYFNLLKKTRYRVDEEETKAFFPMDGVLAGMFSLFGDVLGVRFSQVRPARAWHPDATLHEAADAQSGKALGRFYLDLHPREGKYKHMAVFGLVGGRAEPGGYRAPVCAMVGNFSPPSKTQPALLKHSEVATLFHEFGHVLHQLLTKARHPRFSGTNVLRDFVEAPSQLLENWVWEAPVMERLSGHHQYPSRKLPAETLEAMIGARRLGSGLRTLRQILYGTVDLAYHAPACQGNSPRRPGRSASGLDRAPAFGDSTAVWRRLHDSITLFKLPPGALPQAGFGHLMGGYESSYYGYLWAEVFSADMFTRFQAGGLFDGRVGREYRRLILEPGGGEDEAAQLERFLGRPPNEKAFLKSIGIIKTGPPPRCSPPPPRGEGGERLRRLSPSKRTHLPAGEVSSSP